jgi:hypothetical protein
MLIALSSIFEKSSDLGSSLIEGVSKALYGLSQRVKAVEI